jgi:hypothetical protein
MQKRTTMTRLAISILTVLLLFGQRSNGQTTQDTLDNKYKDAISKADTLFAQRHILVAKYYYATAVQIKPGDKHSIDRLAVCDAFLFCMKQIAKADSFFVSKNYWEANKYYTGGMKYHYDDKYCIEQIRQCNIAIGEIDMKYTQAVYHGDKFFIKKNWSEAITAYKEALTYKPTEKYPSAQIEICEKKIKEQ